MSIDGAAYPCKTLPLSSWLSHGKRSHPSSYRFCISAFHQTLGPPYKRIICMHSYDGPNLHAPILHLSIHPGVRGTSLGDRTLLQNGFFEPYSGKKCKPFVQKLTRRDSDYEEVSSDLESRILEFMDSSERPELFPSRSELMNAGRADLVEAILAKGGWMVAGWDMEPSSGEQAQKLPDSSIAKASGGAKAGSLLEPLGLRNKQPAFMESSLDCLDVLDFEVDIDTSSSEGTHALITASNQVSQSAHAVSLLERQRGWEKVAGLFGLSSMAKPEHGEKPLILATQETTKKHPNVNGTSQLSAHTRFAADSSSYRLDNPIAEESQSSESSPGALGGNRRRRQKPARNRRACLPENETVLSAKKKASKRDCRSTQRRAPHMNSNEQQAKGIAPHMNSYEQQENLKSKGPLSDRIRGLKAELVSTLDILKTGRQALNDDIAVQQRHSIAPTELEEVSDALEFCETEIMNKKRELRTARAQQTAVEGKLALELMEFKKDMEQKDKRLAEGVQVLKMLRTARIVWANPAFEVFLAGSFDGWTSWRRMEKSSAGVFVTALQLYPGQYEIKFIVDGEWRVDPNRPVTWANGYENNVLTIL